MNVSSNTKGLELLRNPLVGSSTFVGSIFTDFNECEFASRGYDTLFLQSLVEIFIGDLVDGDTSSEAFKQLPTCDNFSPSWGNLSFKHLRFGTGS